MITDRVPFELAIKGDKLLKPRFDRLSVPQRTILKAFYGLPLGEEELVFWSISQGGATYDELGYVTAVRMISYSPKEYDTLNLYVGRRSGKTDSVISTAVAYEITLGGHKRFVRPGQEFKVPFIAQTAGDAKQNMNFIKLALEESPLLKGYLAADQVASEIRLTNGLIVEPLPANKSVGRGHAIPVFIGDETAFWYTDPNAANPDFEVLRAIQHAMAQFPDAKIFLGTTPWAEQGVAFKNHKAGTEGRNLQCEKCKADKVVVCEHKLEEREEYEGILSIHASTAAMGNPLISRKRLIQIRKRDPEAFPRESLAETLKVVSGWLSPENIDKAIVVGRHELAPRKGAGIQYVATIDPAFRNDAFAFTIVHHDLKEGIVQDYVRYWEPAVGVPLNPDVVLTEIAFTLAEYGISNVYSDQYQLEALQQLALQKNFTITGHDFTGTSKARITGSFKTSLDQGRVKLLDHELQKTQLQRLQKQVLQSGAVRIAAPNGEHDDLAMVLMLASRMVMWLFADVVAEGEKKKDIDHDHVKMGMEQIERRRREAQMAEDD